MSLTSDEKQKYKEFCKFFGKDVVIEIINGDQYFGKLIDIENPLDVEPEFPMFMIRENSNDRHIVGLYLNRIDNIRLT